MEKQAYKVPEAALILGISKSLAYKLASEGIIPTLKLGKKRILVTKSALERLLKK